MTLFPRHRFFLYSIVFSSLIVCGGGTLLFFADRSRANTVSFYPATCLGGWKDVNRAADKPETSFDIFQDVDSDNSAIAAGDQVAELYCGDWKGDMPSDGLLKSAVLRLSWKFLDDSAAFDVSTTTTATTAESSLVDASVLETIGGLFGDASSTEPVVALYASDPPADTSHVDSDGTRTPASVLEIIEELLGGSSSASDPLLIQKEPDLIDSNLAPADQQSFLWKLFASSVYAEEEPIAYIEYTLDGVLWKSLATASRTNLPREIVLPESDFGSWENLSGLQIKVRRVATISSYPDLLLDGMVININYSEDEIPVVVATPSDFKYFRITDVVSNGHMHATVISDDDQGESISIRSDFTGNIRFYNDADYSFAMTSGVGEGDLVIPAYNFSPGLISAVLTHDPEACADRMLDECTSQENFIGVFHFRVNATALTPVPRSDILEE
jgi:hypothetical protein